MRAIRLHQVGGSKITRILIEKVGADEANGTDVRPLSRV